MFDFPGLSGTSEKMYGQKNGKCTLYIHICIWTEIREVYTVHTYYMYMDRNTGSLHMNEQ